MADTPQTPEQILQYLQAQAQMAEQERAQEVDKLIETGRETLGAQAFDEASQTIADTLGDGKHALTDIVRQFDNAPEILEHLANNPGRLENLKKLNPARIAVEIAKIQSQLSPHGHLPTTGVEPAWRNTARRGGRVSDSDWASNYGAQLSDAAWGKEFDRRQAARNGEQRVRGDAMAWARRVRSR